MRFKECNVEYSVNSRIRVAEKELIGSTKVKDFIYLTIIADKIDIID